LLWGKQQVNVSDLGLTSAEQSVLRRLVGKRYNPGRNEITLVADQFPSRVENKKYLVLLLENLCSEARRLATEFKDEIKPRSSRTSSAQS
jgi:small subunit ribosomal protein S35